MDAETLTALGFDNKRLLRREDGVSMDAEASASFDVLRARSWEAGFDLRIASGHRSYERQLEIFDAKWQGRRPVLDDNNQPLIRDRFTDEEWLHAILRFSALPGTSRHHWGTDIDVYDSKNLPNNTQIQLTQSEYSTGGIFAGISRWLDIEFAEERGEGFYRPYHHDYGGVAIEPWHLSYRPRAGIMRDRVSPDALMRLWSADESLRPRCFDLLKDQLDNVFERYVR